MNPRNLDQQFALGIAWLGGLRLVTQLLAWIGTIVVVRFITPVDYGVAGMAGLYLTIATLVADFGISGAVVATPGLTEEDFSQLHALAVILGVISCALSLLLAWPLSAFFREPLLPQVVGVMSLVLLFNGVRSVPRAIMQRNLEYRNTALVEAVRSVVQTVVVLAAALAGLGYWAFAFGAVAGSLSATIAVLSIRGTTVARPSIVRLARPLHYARNVLGGALAWQTYSISDFIVVGRTRGSQALGHYTLAWNVASVPGEKLTTLLTMVSSSFFAALREDRPSMRRYFLLLTEGISMLTFPVLAGIAFVAPDAIVVLWGQEWRAAIVPARLLAAYAMLNSLATPFSQVLTATDQVVAARRNSVFALALLVPAFYLASVTLGIYAVAACWLVLYPVVNAKPFSLICATLSLSVGEYLAALRPAALVTCAILVALVGLRLGITRMLDPTLRLVIEIGGGVAAGIIALRLTYWNRMRTVWRVVRADPVDPASSEHLSSP